MSNMAGQFVLAGLWAATGIAGLRAARTRRFADHRRWMIRNYAATLTGIASRPWGGIMAALVIPMANGPMYHGDPTLIVRDIASGGIWLAILGNTAIAEIWLQHHARSRQAPALARH